MTTAQHTTAAHAELDLANTTAASLHRAPSEAALCSRIALALECCTAAGTHARAAGLLDVLRAAEQLAHNIRAAVVVTAAQAA